MLASPFSSDLRDALALLDVPNSAQVGAAVEQAIAAIKGGAPVTADTLKKIADLLEEDREALQEIHDALAAKASIEAMNSQFAALAPKGGTIHVAATGSDAASGVENAKMRTLNAALDRLGGHGTILVEYGEYGPELRIDPTKVKNVTILGMHPRTARQFDKRALVRCTDMITGWTKVDGYTNVWVAPVASLPAFASFQWAYLDGRSDPRTAIAAAERHPLHRGRSHRLLDVCKLVKTTATTLAAACAEIDAGGASNPKAWPDTANGLLYRYGEAGDADKCYLDPAEGLISLNGQTTTIYETCGILNIIGLEVRYGGIDLRPFRAHYLDEVRAIGARSNVVNYKNLRFGTLETACGGSQDQLNGDGLNGGSGAKMPAGQSLYTHDNWDDGESCHGAGSVRMTYALAEYNGGGGITPAAGVDAIYLGGISRNNQAFGRGNYKRAQCFVTAAPDGADGGGDAAGTLAGVDTHAVFMNFVTYGGTTGFADSSETAGQTNNRASCYNCFAYDYASNGFGFDVSGYLVNCYGASVNGGKLRKANRGIVRNATLITGATSET